MGGADIVEFTYGNLDRLTLAEYSIDDGNEAFTIDDLGNRDSVNVRDGNNVDYDIDNLTNRYDSVGGNTLAYDAAGNLTTDKDGYQYEYDYENRITKIIKSGPTTVAEFAYDALGRRIKKRDSIANTNNIYYYNDNWQILCDYNDAGTPQSWFAYGNYIDEVVLMSKSFTSWLSARYCIQDHLYSPAALMGATGASTIERYEYDAYGNCYIMDAYYNPRLSSLYGNPYAFEGKRLDLLDGGELELMAWPYRDYCTYLGRWLQEEKLGMIPNDKASRNPFSPLGQYADGMGSYEAFVSNPITAADPYGLEVGWPPPYWPPPPGPAPLRTLNCPHGSCPTGWLDPLPSSGSILDWHEHDARAHFMGRSGADVEFSHTSFFAHRLAERKGFFEWSTPRGTEGVLIDIRSRGQYYANNLGPCDCTCFGYSNSGVVHGWAITEHDGIDDWSGLINICKDSADQYCGLAYTVRCCVKKACVHGSFVGELVCRVRFDLKDKWSVDSAPRFIRILGVPFWHIVHFDKTADEVLPLP